MARKQTLYSLLSAAFSLTMLFASACGDAPQPSPTMSLGGGVTTNSPLPTGQAMPSPKKQYAAYPPMVIDQNKQYTAIIETTKGNLAIELFAKDVPKTVNNFVFLARDGFYDGLTFHRVIKTPTPFMAQGGDPTGTGSGGPGYMFENEITSHKHVTGAVSMARRPQPDTNGSQFFITYAPAPHLDGGYSVFGQLIEGMDVLKKLENGDVMIKVTIIEK